MARVATIRSTLRRGLNAGAKLRAGLALRPESVSPETPTDVYQALLSLYLFFSRFTRGERVLDLGCGCGQGSHELVRRGARAVLGIDIDPRSIRYASRHFAGERTEFRVGDAEALPADLGRFGVVVSSNVFEHLNQPVMALDRVCEVLDTGGTFALAVPPIYDAASQALHERIWHHRSNLAIGTWLAELESRFTHVAQFAHFPGDGVEPDMDSPFRSKLTPEDFRFAEVAGRSTAYPTLTAIFVATGPKR
jgi:2-polyprenyl-3-methyl-5-hydroxy-6-metoxy-1,4-benzoquinol methylase